MIQITSRISDRRWLFSRKGLKEWIWLVPVDQVVANRMLFQTLRLLEVVIQISTLNNIQIWHPLTLKYSTILLWVDAEVKVTMKNSFNPSKHSYLPTLFLKKIHGKTLSSRMKMIELASLLNLCITNRKTLVNCSLISKNIILSKNQLWRLTHSNVCS